MSCHSTNYRGAREFLKILRMHCQKNGIPREVCLDGSSICMSHETREFFKRYNITHGVSSVGNPHSNNRGELSAKSLKRLLREYEARYPYKSVERVGNWRLCPTSKPQRQTPVEVGSGWRGDSQEWVFKLFSKNI